MWLLILVTIFLVGIAIGRCSMRLSFFRHKAGNLRIDRSDPEGPYMFLELSVPGISIVEKKKYVVLDIVAENYISRK